jgi:hypothetical protein
MLRSFGYIRYVLIPRSLSLRRRNNSIVTSTTTATAISMVAAAVVVGLIISRIPLNI